MQAGFCTEDSINLHEKLESALRAEVPITDTRALEIAEATLPPTELRQFRTWFDVNGTSLIKRLNG